MALIDISNASSEYDKLNVFLKDLPNIVRRIFNQDTNNYFDTLKKIPSANALVFFINKSYNDQLRNYTDKIKNKLRFSNLNEVLVKEDNLKNRFESNLIYSVGLGVQINFINNIWRELSDARNNSPIDVTNKTQLGLLTMVVGIILFVLGILRHVLYEIGEIIYVLDYFLIGLDEINMEIIEKQQTI
ncbi:MAG: hypothetical protein JNJ40_09090 [Bacteroidia bacterium]|nr:hypothetical protein [Bacteroidia bacterium]